MSQQRLTVLSNMDQEAENMDEMSSSPAFSINSVASEISKIQAAVDLDELMHCDDFSDNEDRLSICSWCSSLDSDISEVITSFDQSVDEVIRQVCQSFLYPENLDAEADDFGENEEVWTAATESTFTLANRSESARPASCASSFSTNSAITMAAKILVSEVIDKAVKTLQSTEAVKTLQSTEAVKTLQSTEAVSTLQSTEVVKTLQSNEAVKTLQSSEAVSTLQPPEAAKTLQSTEAAKTLQSTEAAKTLQSSEAVSTLQSTEAAKTLQSSEAVSTLQSTETAKTLQSTEAVSTLQSSEAVSTLQSSEAVKTLQSSEAVKTIKDSVAPAQSDLSPIPLGLLDEDVTTEETGHAGGCKGKKSQWKRCFSVWRQKKILPAPLEHLDDAVRSASADLTSWTSGESKRSSHCSQEMPSTTSSSAAVAVDLRSTQLDTMIVESQEEMSTSLPHQCTDSGDKDKETFSQSSVDQPQPASEFLCNDQVDVEETKAKKSNSFFRFFHNIFSKNEKTIEKKKWSSVETHTKWPSLWKQLL